MKANENLDASHQVVIGASPNQGDMAIVSIDANGFSGVLNKLVLTDYGYDESILISTNLKKGYDVVQGKGKYTKPILLIVTVGRGKTDYLLSENLFQGITHNLELLSHKTVWIPLMGTGAGGLTLYESYIITSGILNRFLNHNIEFLISFPEEGGREAIDQLNYSENQKHSLSSIENLEGASLGKSATTGSLEGTVLEKSSTIDDIKEQEVKKQVRETLERIQGKSKKRKPKEKENVLRDIQSELGQRQYFLASHIINKEDEIERFLEDGIWENNFDRSGIRTLKKVNPGDILFLKSKFTEEKIIHFKIKAVGAVISDLEEDSGLNVKWHQIIETNVAGLTNYRSHFIKIIAKDINPLLNKILEINTNIVETINNLLIDDADENITDKMQFQIDNVEVVDRLNREALAKSFTRLVNKEVFDLDNMDHSFMVHLQGEWGAGKSTFLNLIKNNLNTSKRKWIVVNYNAWQNQHLSPPWWSLIQQIFIQARKEIFSGGKFILNFKEFFRRLRFYGRWQKFVPFAISLVLLTVLIIYSGSIVNVTGELKTSEWTIKKIGEILNGEIIGLLVGLASVIGLVFTFTNYISSPFILSNSEGAKSFMSRSADPMNKVKKHFEGLISNINKMDYELAVFIDDIDRCDRIYVVQLLEGIQTLFKNKRVLYVVAGDKNWISTCFENNYAEFKDKVSKNGEDLGNLFLEKAFQLSIRMPNISKRTKELYWNYILGITKPEGQLKDKISKTLKAEIKERVLQAYSSTHHADSNELRRLEEEFQLSEQIISEVAIEALDESKHEVGHLFSNNYALIDPNPRSIKRLANNYTMSRNTLIAERKDYNPEKVFRWLVLEDKQPKLVAFFLEQEDILITDDYLEENKIVASELEKVNTIIYDKDNLQGGALELQELKDILGL